MRSRYWIVSLILCMALLSAAQRKDTENKHSFVTIPSGTNITVQLNYQNHATGSSLEGKVVWPVQIGFTNVIPVGSRVKAGTFIQYADTDRWHTSPVEMVQLMTITVDDKTYDVESNALRLETGATETKFTLVSDLKIEK